MTEDLAQPFADAVGAKTGCSPSDVEAVLGRHGVVPAPQPPSARSLSLVSIAFSGEKQMDDGKRTAIDFRWRVDAPGLWGIASEENSVGKSTILQVAMWALRGAQKRLTSTVESWLHHVEVIFRADGKSIEIRFDLVAGKPVGIVKQSGPAGTYEQTFQDEEQFKRLMQELMLQALSLDPIPASRTMTDGRVLAYEDGWAAYTGAFLSDAYSNAIIGESIPGTDVTSRLLQVFLGLPWATTVFQARSRRRLLASEAEQRRRKLAGLGGRSIQDVEQELADIRLKMKDEGLQSRNVQALLDAEKAYDDAATQVLKARRDADEAKISAAQAKDEEIRALRFVNALLEEQAASTFLRRLSPVCCPRCERPISLDRRQRESNDRICSVCSEHVPPMDRTMDVAELSEATKRGDETKRLAADTAKAARDLDERYSKARKTLEQAGRKFQSLATGGTAADVQMLARSAERLEGMLEVARAIVQADGADDIAVKILEAAEAEAGRRLNAVADALLEKTSDEVMRIAGRLGVRDLTKVELKRNANVTIQQGGATSSFSKMSAGEQLRLRVATVAALVRSAGMSGAGRHPGLLFIDSPGGEEMSEVNLESMLKELAALAAEIPNLQIFVAMRGLDSAKAAIASDRLLTAEKGHFLW